MSTMLATTGSDKSYVPEAWPAGAQILFRRLHRALFLPTVITFMVIPAVFIPLMIIGGQVNLYGFATVLGGLLFLLGALYCLLGWWDYRQTYRRLQNLIEGEHLVHWNYRYDDLKWFFRPEVQMPDRLEAYISMDSAYFADGISWWGARRIFRDSTYLTNVQLFSNADGHFMSLSIRYEYPLSRVPPYHQQMLIPVPAGKEEEARNVVERLKEKVIPA